MERKPPKLEDLAAPTDASIRRRASFVASTAVVWIGGLAAIFPVAVGLAVFMDPLRHDDDGSKTVAVTTLRSVPDDGIPRQFTVCIRPRDAWASYPSQPIGSVYLIRQPGQPTATALSAACPHVGCELAYDPQAELFQCPCYAEAFTLEGKRTPDNYISPRDMDSLECWTSGETIWVKFQSFRMALRDKMVRR